MAANEITREMPTRFVEFSRMILVKIRFVYPIEVSESDGDDFSMLIDDECCSVRHVILLIFVVRIKTFFTLSFSLFFFITIMLIYFINFYFVDKILHRPDCFSLKRFNLFYFVISFFIVSLVILSFNHKL